ncbi:MAG: ATP synthase subunit I [bacterium]
MSENLKFFIHISGITSALLVISLIAVNFLGNSQLALGVLYGYLVSLINILFAFFSIKWAFNKSTKTFFAVVLGGMGMRFVFIMIALFLVWKITNVPLIGFIVSLVCFYLTLQFFEVRFIQNTLNSKKTS